MTGTAKTTTATGGFLRGLLAPPNQDVFFDGQHGELCTRGLLDNGGGPMNGSLEKQLLLAAGAYFWLVEHLKRTKQYQSQAHPLVKEALDQHCAWAQAGGFIGMTQKTPTARG